MKLIHRPGISLLEVLISMFVLVIGLLGVAAMFPVGQSYVFEAAQYDRSATLGQAAFNEIQVRGMLRMDFNRPFDFWLRPDSPPGGANPFVPGMSPVPNGAVDLRGIAFAIDPLACATNMATGGTANVTNFPAFPPTGAAGPRLTRATLFAHRDVATGTIVALSRAVAEQLFMSHDELSIDLPSDRDTPAIQLIRRTSDGQPIKRQFEGQYSWLFTVVPALEMGREDLYTVSVVVFHKRILPTDPADPQPPERMVQISSNEGKLLGGWGGGDAQLTAPTSLLLDDVRTGQWCLLSAWLNNDPSSNMPIFKWYRIVSVEKEVQAEQAGFTRWVTLTGPDWDPRLTTSVSLFDGAIAVYEKTMRIEGASLYGGP